MALEKIALEFVHFTESSLVMEFFEWMQHYLECQNYCKDSNLFTRWWSIYSDLAKKMWSGGVGISTNQCLGRSITKSCPVCGWFLEPHNFWTDCGGKILELSTWALLLSLMQHTVPPLGARTLTLSLVSSQCVVYNRWKGEKRFLGISTYYAQWCGNMI